MKLQFKSFLSVLFLICFLSSCKKSTISLDANVVIYAHYVQKIDELKDQYNAQDSVQSEQTKALIDLNGQLLDNFYDRVDPPKDEITIPIYICCSKRPRCIEKRCWIPDANNVSSIKSEVELDGCEISDLTGKKLAIIDPNKFKKLRNGHFIYEFNNFTKESYDEFIITLTEKGNEREYIANFNRR